MVNAARSRSHSRRSRNRRIGEFLKELEMTEGRSTGIPRLLKAMATNGLPAPLFETDEDRLSFVVRLPHHPLSLVPPVGAGEVTGEVAGEVAGEVERLHRAVAGEMSRKQLQSTLGLKGEEHFQITYLRPALA